MPLQNKELTTTETILATSIAAVALIYVFYFLIIPQSWGLMDDYAFALNWGHDFHPVKEGMAFLKELISVGRFRPLDALARVLRYGLLPVTPRAFHASQMGLALVAISAFAVSLQRLGLKRSQVLWGVLLVAANLSMKEWIVYTTAAESLATCFLFIALAFYLSNRKWISVFFFVCAFLSKESFFILIAPFFAYEALVYLKYRKLEKLLPLCAMTLSVIIFLIFIRSLPALYTSGLSLKQLNLSKIFKALTLPTIKSFGPALVLALYMFLRGLARPNKLGRQSGAIIIGGTILLVYSALLAAWGPFDSWAYLHIPIPFGWAMVLAAFWDEDAWISDKFFTVLFAFNIAFFILATLNGSRNVTSFLADAKVAAAIACEDSSRVPNLTIYSNCDEGSAQLKNMLILDKSCPKPPTFEYLKRTQKMPADVKAPYEFIITSKCDPFEIESVPASFKQQFSYWTILKSF